ncbi:hypothetical protein HanIR_Chr15g0767681 [Helianthus annuus]|nr:hypothetical protein HanIR_Chr15g0767681 [Helianthus annuus]
MLSDKIWCYICYKMLYSVHSIIWCYIVLYGVYMVLNNVIYSVIIHFSHFWISV